MEPVSFYALPDSKGACVWDPQDAVRIRREERVLGLLVGGVAQFKNQNQVNGLPLLLSPHEVATATARGAAVLKPPVLGALGIRLAGRRLDGQADGSQAGDTFCPRKRARRQQGSEEMYQQQYEQYHALLGAYGPEQQAAALQAQAAEQAEAKAGRGPGSANGSASQANGSAQAVTAAEGKGQQGKGKGKSDQGQPPQAQQPQGQKPGKGGKQGNKEPQEGGRTGQADKGPQGTGSAEAAGSDSTTWRQALADMMPFDMPIGAHDPRLAHQGPPQQLEQQLEQEQIRAEQAAGVGASGQGKPSVQEIRNTIYQELNSQGYALSSGPKFGAHMLAYPGDPCLYHAQFTVRALEADVPLNPHALKAAARGSHAARKHVLLATLLSAGKGEGQGGERQGQEQGLKLQPFYITIAPEAGFGASKG